MNQPEYTYTLPHIALNLKQICQGLQLTPNTVYKLVADGKLHGVKVGNKWRFRTDAIEEFLRGQK